MIRVALKGLLGRKFRAATVSLAIVLGVAMVCGTFVLTAADCSGKGASFLVAQSHNE